MLTLSDFQTRLRYLTNEAGTSFYSDAMFTRWINDGERDISIRSLCYEREWGIITSANTRSYLVPAIKVHNVDYLPSSGGRKGLAKITPLMAGHQTTEDSSPKFWFPWGGQICVEPVPDAAYSLLVYASFLPTAEMSALTDSPEIPEFSQKYIVDYAMIRAFMRDKKLGSAARKLGEYVLAMRAIRSLVLARTVNSRSGMTPPDIIEAQRPQNG